MDEVHKILFSSFSLSLSLSLNTFMTHIFGNFSFTRRNWLLYSVVITKLMLNFVMVVVVVMVVAVVVVTYTGLILWAQNWPLGLGLGLGLDLVLVLTLALALALALSLFLIEVEQSYWLESLIFTPVVSKLFSDLIKMDIELLKTQLVCQHKAYKNALELFIKQTNERIWSCETIVIDLARRLEFT